MSTKDKFIADLKRVGQSEMAAWALNVKDTDLEKQLEQVWKGKRYFAICKTCNKIYVDLPFKEYYKSHTFPEWDIWFCDAVLHWAETDGKHSIYCFGDDRKYDLSSSLAFDCRNETWPQIKRDMKDVVTMRKNFVARGKRENWVMPLASSELKGEQ